jgi:3-keto-5-aminohexanoate cleavage enzyme
LACAKRLSNSEQQLHMSMASNPTLEPVALAVAPNGGRRGKSDHPALPITPAEVARTAAQCAEAGAAMIHLHVRDRYGRHVLDADAYRAATDAIHREAGSEIVVQITSESLGCYAPVEQMGVVRATRPEAVSLALREMVPTAAHELAFAAFLAELQDIEAMPQIIVYTPEELRELLNMRARGVIPFADIPVLLALGRYVEGQIARPSALLPFLNAGIEKFGHWSCCAFGPHELRTVTSAALFGGHVRVGFENNLHLPDGALAPDNASLVEVAAVALRSLSSPLATGFGLRETLRALLADGQNRGR